MNHTPDYIVIGSGVAGLRAAAKLAESFYDHEETIAWLPQNLHLI